METTEKSSPGTSELVALAGLLQVEPVLSEVLSTIALRIGQLHYLQKALKGVLEEEGDVPPEELVKRIESELKRSARRARHTGRGLHQIETLLDEAGVGEELLGDVAGRVRQLIESHNGAKGQLSMVSPLGEDATLGDYVELVSEELWERRNNAREASVAPARIAVAHQDVREEGGGPSSEALAFFKTQEFIGSLMHLVERVHELDEEKPGLDLAHEVLEAFWALCHTVGLNHNLVEARAEAVARVRQALQYLATKMDCHDKLVAESHNALDAAGVELENKTVPERIRALVIPHQDAMDALKVYDYIRSYMYGASDASAGAIIADFRKRSQEQFALQQEYDLARDAFDAAEAGIREETLAARIGILAKRAEVLATQLREARGQIDALTTSATHPRSNKPQAQEAPKDIPVACDSAGTTKVFLKTQELIGALVQLVESARLLRVKGSPEAQRDVIETFEDVCLAVALLPDKVHEGDRRTPARVRAALRWLATRKEPASEAKVTTQEPRTHHVKSWPPHFELVDEGKKNFDVRRNDRGYAAGDILHLREWEPRPGDAGAYTGNACYRRIAYVLEKFDGLKEGYVVLGLEATRDEPCVSDKKVKFDPGDHLEATFAPKDWLPMHCPEPGTGAGAPEFKVTYGGGEQFVAVERSETGSTICGGNAEAMEGIFRIWLKRQGEDHGTEHLRDGT